MRYLCPFLWENVQFFLKKAFLKRLRRKSGAETFVKKSPRRFNILKKYVEKLQ